MALGDPAGADSDRISAVWRMRDLAQQEGRHPAVWRAGRSLLRVYAGFGLSALPLDPDGRPGESADERAQGPEETFLVCMAERDLPALLPLLVSLPRADGETQEQPPARQPVTQR
jgi:phosphatidylglycerol lysyltransferase